MLERALSGGVDVPRRDSTDPAFAEHLTEAVAATGATLAFDAIGGGALAGTILGCMEAAANRGATSYSRYGSSQHKQVYIYGNLDQRPTVIERRFGLAWGIGGWLLTWFLEKIGPEARGAMQARVGAELRTTFASRYTAEISLHDALRPEVITAIAQLGTGAKYLINPSKASA